MKNLLLSILLFSCFAAFGQNSFDRWVPISGTNTYTTNITSYPASYNNTKIYGQFTNGNTTNATFQIPALSAVPIRKWDGDSWELLVSGDIDAGDYAELVYDNSNAYFRLIVIKSAGSGGGGTGDLEIGVSAVDGGTTTRVLYDNAGVLGEYVTSGTGNVAMTTSPVFTTPNIGTATGSITGNAATVTTNANLTGPITSVGNATSIANDVALPGNPTTTTQSAGTNNTTISTTAYADAKVANTISNGVTAIAPAQDAVFDALSLKADEQMNVNNQTGSYTLVLTDADTKLVEMNSASSNDVTIPANASIAFPLGTVITIVQQGAGTTSLVASGGVTIRTQSGSLASPGQYSPMVIEKRATDEWYLWNGTSSITASNGLSITSGNIKLGGPLTETTNISGSFRVGLDITPTAHLHISAGGTAASGAPLKFTSAAVMTTAEAGAIEFLTDDLFFTISTGAARKGIILDNGNRLTSGRVPFATTNGRLIDQSGFSFASSILTVPNLINSGLTTGRVTFATTSGQLTDDSGFLFSGTNDLLTARLTPPAGTTAASTAPIKLTSGTNMTTPEAGAVEFDGTNYFVTSSTTRYTLSKTLTATATLDFPAAGASLSTDLTITVTGAADGDPVIVTPPNASTVTNGIFTAWVSAANTVTVRFSNLNLVTNPDPASGTFRASVLKY